MPGSSLCLRNEGRILPCALLLVLVLVVNLFYAFTLFGDGDSPVFSEEVFIRANLLAKIFSTEDYSSNQTSSTNVKIKPYELCFVTSLFASSNEKADRPQNVTEMQESNPSFRFYAFTNLPDLDAAGWTLLIRHFPYKRSITQSRWGKFMSWREKEITDNCRAVIYMDGVVELKGKANAYRDLALLVRQSEYGLAQVLHPKGFGISQEFREIARVKKDIKSNIAKSLEWFKSQPDYRSNITVYQNTYMGELTHCCFCRNLVNLLTGFILA